MTVFADTAYHTEFINGREIQKPFPKNLHGFIQSFLQQWFGRELPKQYRVVSELNVICGHDRLVPDVVVIPRSARFVDGDLADPPMLAVEIMSPGQTLSELLDRCERLLTAGTPVCWIIWPERRKAWTYTSEETLKEDSKALRMMLMDEPLDLSLSEMWAELAE